MKNEHQFPTVPRLTTIRGVLRFLKNPVPPLIALHEKYGDSYHMYIGGMIKSLVTRDPEIIQAVLQKDHRNFEKSDLQTKKVGYYIGKGLLTNTGENWLKQRRLIQPGFHRERLENLIALMMEVITAMGDKLDKEGKNAALDISHLMMELSFQIIAKTLFSQQTSEKELKVLSEGITTVQAFIIKQIRLPFLGPYYALSGKIKKHKDLADDMRGQLFRYVEERRKSKEETSDLLDMLLEARYEDNGEPMSDQQLIDEILVLFAAGHETSANALGWVWYLLSKHPWATKKIREEAATFFAQPITLQSLKELSFTTRVIQETMRMYPPAWITDRIALNNVKLSDEKVAKDYLITIFIYGVHYNPKYWKDPERFDPDRFLPERKKMRPSFAYLPFGGGPRLCIGNNFSMMEMQLAVAYLAHHFDFSLCADKDIDIHPMVTLRSAEKIMMNWKRRK